jgi:hypothetical protein
MPGRRAADEVNDHGPLRRRAIPLRDGREAADAVVLAVKPVADTNTMWKGCVCWSDAKVARRVVARRRTPRLLGVRW